jgi:N4-gp56 family major capsid protein
MGITDVIQDTHEDPVLRTMSMLCGEQAGETKEMLMWGVLTGGTNVFNATGANLTLAELRSIKAALVRNRAKMVSKILNPSPNIKTSYVEASFVVIGHSDLESDLRSMVDTVGTGASATTEKVFIPTAAYGSRQVIHENEVGSIENFRFILSPYYTPTNSMKKQMVILGQDCFGTVPLKGKNSIQNFVLNPGTARGTDPLGCAYALAA